MTRRPSSSGIASRPAPWTRPATRPSSFSLDHHERLDGSGYPRALRAEQLDLETRVLAVCDVVDALISRRVYREAWSQDDALALLRREAVDDGLGTFPATDRRPELAHVGTR